MCGGIFLSNSHFGTIFPYTIHILNALLIQNHVIILPPLYFGFCPQNPCEMIENAMKAFYNLVSICFLHYSIYSFNLFNN
jgi:hypothetical protein